MPLLLEILLLAGIGYLIYYKFFRKRKLPEMYVLIKRSEPAKYLNLPPSKINSKIVMYYKGRPVREELFSEYSELLRRLPVFDMRPFEEIKIKGVIDLSKGIEL